MARTKDTVVEDVRRVRRRISRELATAWKKGRLLQELRRRGREARKWMGNGDEAPARRNGRSRR